MPGNLHLIALRGSCSAVVSLPRSLHVEPHEVLRLQQKSALPVRKVPCFEICKVLKVLCLPRNHHMKALPEKITKKSSPSYESATRKIHKKCKNTRNRDPSCRWKMGCDPAFEELFFVLRFQRGHFFMVQADLLQPFYGSDYVVWLCRTVSGNAWRPANP